jgi:peptidyl-prolyl cis-trans isomerase SurA
LKHFEREARRKAGQTAKGEVFPQRFTGSALELPYTRRMHTAASASGLRHLFLLVNLGALITAACGDDDAPPATPEVADEVAPAPEPEPEGEPAVDEACAQVLVVSFAGAAYSPEGITRSESDARVRAEELRLRLDDRNDDFATLARAESDAASSGPRGGLIGTYARDEWPAAHGAIRDAVFGLEVGQISEVLETSYGYVVARRCPVEKIHTRHILIRHRGARNAPPDTVRDEQAARLIVEQIKQTLNDGADFESVAREHSEDASASRGGDMGPVGRGLLAPEYETAAWALAPGAISDPVQTDFGFHLVQRVE